MRFWVLFVAVLFLMACNLATPSTDPTQAPVPTQPDPIDLGNLSYWHAFAINELTPTPNDVVYFDQIVLRRVESDTPRTGDVETDVQNTLQVLFDNQTIWNAGDISFESVTFNNGQATISLNGTITAVGGSVLNVARSQMIFTVFEVPEVQRFLMTTDGRNIANLGVAHESQALPDDWEFVRESLSGDARLYP